MKDLVIRPEEAGDREQVFEVNAQAFETDAEARLVDALRPVTEPLISLVAILKDRVAGHILFTPITVDNAPEAAATMALGPMAVLPELQKQGIGSMLVPAGLEECRSLATEAVFVMGHAEYYPRFGFTPAAPLGLRYKSERFDPYFMVIELRPGTLASMSGHVYYRPEFEGL